MSAEESLQHRFKRFIATYKASIINHDYESAMDERYQKAVAQHIVTAQELWELVARIGLHNASTSTDTIDDLPTHTIELLRLPFIIGDLWSRVQGKKDDGEDDDDEDDDPTSPAARRKRMLLQQQKGSSSSATAVAAGPTNSNTATEPANFSMTTRAEALTKSQKWFEVMLRMIVDLELMQAKDIEIHLGNVFEDGVVRDFDDGGDDSDKGSGSTRVMNHVISSRTAKIQLAQHQRDIGRLLTQTENEMLFRRMKAARMRRLAVEDDEDNNSRSSGSDDDDDEEGGPKHSSSKAVVDTETGRTNDFAARRQGRRAVAVDGVMHVGGEGNGDGDEDDDENEEARRTLAILYLKWCTGEAIQNVIMSNRELEMVSRLTPEARKRIAQEYQENIELWASRKNDLGKQTYTILPGGMIAPGDAPMHSTTFGTNYMNYREQVRAELMVDRNLPTMTLQEYAEWEMAGIADQQRKANENAIAQAEEDLRLGEEGIEERERKKQADWDDWRDAHPAYGITNKGNYS